MSDILSGLNSAQQEAASADGGQILILAGAGSGKTRTITHRVAWLLEQGKASPEQILVVTFTNKAAAELRERLSALLNEEQAAGVWAMTFHALCLRMLRQSGPAIGIANDFSVLGVADSRKLLSQVAEELGDSSAGRADEMRKIRSLISKAKNADQSPSALSGPLGIRAAAMWRAYDAECRNINALDFDDLLLKGRKLLAAEAGSGKWSSRFKYIMVDEYQDVNRVQEELLRGVSSAHQNLCVVGDDSQSVYAFRGAEVEHILRFRERWPQCRIFKLQQNYRSSAAILQAAQAVIDQASHASGKQLVATLPQGAPVMLLRFGSQWDEAAFIADRVRQLSKQGVELNDIAIAYRTNAQSQPLEEALQKNALAYTVIGGVSFMRRTEVQSLRSYLALLANPRDRLALDRVASWPRRGLGPAALKSIADQAQEGEGNLLIAMAELLESGSLKGKAASGAAELFSVFVKAFESQAQGQPLGAVIRLILQESGAYRMLRSAGEKGVEQLLNIDGLVEQAERFSGPAIDSLPDWLAETALTESSDGSAANGVKLMTLHAAKGLEFPYVFLSGLEEQLFLRGDVSRKELEEERRLLYVGMTRAERELVMSYSDLRRQWGREISTQPLQFLFDLPPQVVRKRAATKTGRPEPKGSDKRASGAGKIEDKEIYRRKPAVKKSAPAAADQSVNLNDFPAGCKVTHPKFGEGIVTGHKDGSLQVKFSGRLRTLKPEYARLRKL